MHSHPLKKKKTNLKQLGIFHCYGNHCWFTFVFYYVLFWFGNLSEIAPVHNTKKHPIFTKLACSDT